MTKLTAFHGKPELKAEILGKLRVHRAADDIIRGEGYGDSDAAHFRGCAVGCTLHAAGETNVETHRLYEPRLGLPAWLAHLSDGIFQGMSGDHASFPVQLINAIPVGANLDTALHRIHSRFQREVVPDPGEINERVAALHDKVAGGETVSDDAWSAAESAAWSAARSAARSAAWSAESAARSAARSAAGSAESAAESAAGSAAGSAESAAWSLCAKIVLEEVAR